MQQFHPEVLRESFPGWEGSFARMPDDLKIFAPALDGKNVWPCSFWIERNRGPGAGGSCVEKTEKKTGARRWWERAPHSTRPATQNRDPGPPVRHEIRN
jgi:hypothetical protein